MPATQPRIWQRVELEYDARLSKELFKESRANEPTRAYPDFYEDSFKRVEEVLNATGNLTNLSRTMSAVLREGYFDVVRYLTAPPISEDDMLTLTQLRTKSARKLSQGDNPGKVYAVIERSLDGKRFPWIGERRDATEGERQLALLSTSTLLASQLIQTKRRNLAKTIQEGSVKRYLRDVLEYQEVDRRQIETAFDAPRARQYCPETKVAGKKADVVIGLGDGRFMCLECKVSNSSTNSYKRLNHETVEKVVHWYSSFGSNGVVCAALLSGVFSINNLEAAQSQGASLFWSHNLAPLGQFVNSTFDHH